ncbi:MAG: spermidine/putrescine transporter substrate-binding protein [Rubritepida sp.]|nr:spermidine/putrescine transporter substrate-binding protein [Rubritepida sp.]
MTTILKAPAYGFSRRSALVAGLATPALIARRSGAAGGQLIVRSPGGAPEESTRRHVWQPFEAETGIRVTPVAATGARVFAMFRSNNHELDVIDIGTATLLTLQRQGGLASIGFGDWRRTDPKDIPEAYRTSHYIGFSLYGTVLGVNTTMSGAEGPPRTWQEFWDVSKFPGPRSLPDMATGLAPLEIALMADGVPLDQIYPIDLDRAFASLSRIKRSISKFWDTGALSVQMLADREVAASAVWSTRIIPAIAGGAPLASSWEGHIIMTQALGIFRNAANMENAQRYVEFALRPDIQANLVQSSRSGPANQKAYEHLPAGYGNDVAGGPGLAGKGVLLNEEWWGDNREVINRRWARWVRS